MGRSSHGGILWAIRQLPRAQAGEDAHRIEPLVAQGDPELGSHGSCIAVCKAAQLLEAQDRHHEPLREMTLAESCMGRC